MVRVLLETQIEVLVQREAAMVLGVQLEGVKVSVERQGKGRI